MYTKSAQGVMCEQNAYIANIKPMGGGGSGHYLLTADDADPMPLYMCLGSLIEGASPGHGNPSTSQSATNQLSIDNGNTPSPA